MSESITVDLLWVVVGYALLAHWWALYCVKMYKLFRPIDNQPPHLSKVVCYIMNLVGFPISLIYANIMLLMGKYDHHIKGK